MLPLYHCIYESVHRARRYLRFALFFVVLVKVTTARTGAGPGGRTRLSPPPPPEIGKYMIFWRKIVIFHRKYPKNVRASLRSAQFVLVRPLS
jgi:hypothetical protein